MRKHWGRGATLHMATIKTLSAEVTFRLRPEVEGDTSMRRARKKGETKAKATGQERK